MTIMARFGVGAVLLLVAACGADDDASGEGDWTVSTQWPGASAAHNDADVAFAQGMIPHHKQAVTMAELAADADASAEVQALAEQIVAAQGPEIEVMTGWLAAWGEDLREMDGHAGHEGHGMPGMMSEARLAELAAATGTTFDELFLTMMIAHHEGAVEMAQTEQADGDNAGAIALAEQIESIQTAEIEQMQALLR